MPNPIKSRQENDDDVDAERPRKKKKRKRSSDSTMQYLLLGGGILGLCLLCTMGIGIAYFVAKRGGSSNAAIVKEGNDKVPAGDKKGKGGRKRLDVRGGGTVAKGKVIFNQPGTLARSDPPDPTPELREVDARMKTHAVQMQPGKTYVITMDSEDFDAYLRVESPTGVRLAEDDDSGGELNARLVFQPNEAGAHRVIATAWDGEVGRYRLKVQEVD